MQADAALPEDNAVDTAVLTAQIMSAYCSNNQVSADALPRLIRDVHAALADVMPGKDAPEAEALVPAVPIRRSVFPDYIVCLEDGKKLKILKRHLYAVYGMTPQAYRERWKLPEEYPMVAPNYAITRSDLAKQAGLGRKLAAEQAS